MSEFFGSGRQSRIALKATGKLGNMTLTGYYEADFLSSGTTSNNNQSNSYTLRQRQLWADAKTASGWDFSGGQGGRWLTETTPGLTRGTEILPSTIDAQYDAGFVWTRQESFRVSKNISARSSSSASPLRIPQTLNPGGNNLPTNYLYRLRRNQRRPLQRAPTRPRVPPRNYTFNYAPGLIVKMAIEPGWGHWEVFGIERTFRDRIYPT